MKKSLVFMCALLGGAALFAQDGARLPFMPQARTGTLENGLRYYVLENRRPENRAFIRLAVKAGSALEEEDERGLAHFVEHMAFNGTARFPESALIDYMRSLGMRFGADLNAYTSFDETVYMLETPTEAGPDGKKTVPRKALDIFDDWTHAVLFNEKDVDEERAVILEEKRARGGAGERLRDELYPLLFEGSPYARRFPIGTAEVISGASAERLRAFYRKWYTPRNMALIIAGDFDADALVARLPALFTAPAAPDAVTPPRFPLPPPEPGALRARVWTDTELSPAQVRLIYKLDWEEPREDKATALRHTLDSLIDRVLGERLAALALDPSSATAGADAGLWHPARTAEFFTMTARAKDGRAGEALGELLALKESVTRYGFGTGEVARAKASLLSDYERAYAERDKRESAGFVEEFTSHFLRGVEAPGIEFELEMVRAFLPRIGPAELAARARAYFAYNDALAFISAPEKEAPALPSEAEVAALVRAAPELAAAPPGEDAEPGDLLPAIPAAGAITAERTDKATGARIFTLGNGARVIMQPTDNKDDDITLYALAKGGTANAEAGETISARLASGIMAGSGLGAWKTVALAKKLAGVQARIGFSAQAFTRSITGDANGAGLTTLFQLLYLQFTAPRMDADALAVERDSLAALLKTRDDNPEQAFGDEVRRVMYRGDPRFMPLDLAGLDRARLDEARAFIDACLNPADWTFVVCGNIDADALRPLLETYLASVPRRPAGAASFGGYPASAVERPGPGTHELYKGKDEKSVVYSSRSVPERFDLPAALCANVLGDYLDIVFTTEIREKLGGVYSIDSSASLSPLPPRDLPRGGRGGELSLEISFACDPRRAVELKDACAALLESVAQGDIDADAYQKARRALLRGLEESLQSNAYVARSIANFVVLFGLDIKTVYRRDKLYEQVTAKKMRAMLRRLLDAGEVSVIMYPAR